MGLVAGCSTAPSWSHAGTTHVAVSGTTGAVTTGFYVQGGRKVAVSNTVPWSIEVGQLSSLELRKADPATSVSVDLRYDSLTAHAHMSTTLDSARATRVIVQNGFSVSRIQ